MLANNGRRPVALDTRLGLNTFGRFVGVSARSCSGVPFQLRAASLIAKDPPSQVDALREIGKARIGPQTCKIALAGNR